MSANYLRTSTRFNHDGKQCEILNIFRDANEVRYREVSDEDVNPYSSKLINLSDFVQKVTDGEFEIEEPKRQNLDRYFSAEEIAKISYREKYVLQAIKQSPSAPTRVVGVDEAIKIVSQETKDPKPPCRSTVQRWISLYQKSGQTKISLSDSYFAVKTRRYQHPEIEEAFQDCIADYYLRKDSFPVEKIYKLFLQRCEAIQAENTGDPKYDFKIPSLSTLRNRIKAFTDEELLVAKFGKTNAKQKILAKLKKFRVSTILERCEMDGLHIHIGIVDKNNSNIFLGSIVLMYVMDVYSRTILGYSLHLTKKKSETSDLIISCLKHTFSIDKDPRWPIVNKIPFLATDASAPATSDLCNPYFVENGITLLITRTGLPQQKPFIESLNNTIRRMFLRHLPGYLGREKFRNNLIKLSDSVKKQASITLDGFIKEFEHFIHEVYHKNPHSGLLGRAPIDVWNDEFKNLPLALQNQVRLPVATEVHGGRTERKFLKAEDGFTVDRRWYRDADLHKWLISSSDGQSGYSESDVFEKVKILYSNIDVRSITVIHPKTKQPRIVPLSDLENLNLEDNKPLQREEYLNMIENNYRHLDTASKRFYEPSQETLQQSRDIEKNRNKLLAETKKSQSKNRTEMTKHPVLGSNEYDAEVKNHIQNSFPQNVVVHESSMAPRHDNHTDECWEDEIDIDNVGAWE
ncbi:MAG: hypothetical protein NWQ54_22240 [Paraglaciecola sp.]|nr:hypothetical protein [Paraglaciecola sp.]